MVPPSHGKIDIGNAATSRNEDTARGRLQATGRVAGEPRMGVEHGARGIVYMATWRSTPMSSS